MKTVEFEDCTCDANTRLALHVVLPNGQSFWAPRSVVQEDGDVQEEGDEGVVSLAAWWVEKEDVEALAEVQVDTSGADILKGMGLLR